MLHIEHAPKKLICNLFLLDCSHFATAGTFIVDIHRLSFAIGPVAKISLLDLLLF